MAPSPPAAAVPFSHLAARSPPFRASPQSPGAAPALSRSAKSPCARSFRASVPCACCPPPLREFPPRPGKRTSTLPAESSARGCHCRPRGRALNRRTARTPTVAAAPASAASASWKRPMLDREERVASAVVCADQGARAAEAGALAAPAVPPGATPGGAGEQNGETARARARASSSDRGEARERDRRCPDARTRTPPGDRSHPPHSHASPAIGDTPRVPAPRTTLSAAPRPAAARALPRRSSDRSVPPPPTRSFPSLPPIDACFPPPAPLRPLRASDRGAR